MAAPRPFRTGLDFPHAWQARAIAPQSGSHIQHYPAELAAEDRRGLWLEVTPAGNPPWVGFFALGFAAEEAVNGIFSCPHPQWLCAASGGYAYLVNTAAPREFTQALTPQKPVLDVRQATAANLLLLVSFTTIAAYGPHGFAWESQPLSWEGISITDISGTTLRGRGWDVLTDREADFVLDLTTGAHSGGASPRP